MRTFKSMYLTEFKLSLRHLDLPIFGLLFPVCVALLLGFLNPTPTSLDKIFASASTIGIAANGLMGLPLTLADYRSKKILKQLEVTPVKKSLILLVHFLIKFSMAVLSVLLIWLSLRLFLNYNFTGSLLFFVIGYLLTTLVIFGIGMMIASFTANANTVTILTTIIYFPMLFLSGATIPLSLLPKFLVTILQVLPLTQGIKLLENAAAGISLISSTFTVIYLLLLGIFAILFSIKYFRWE